MEGGGRWCGTVAPAGRFLQVRASLRALRSPKAAAAFLSTQPVIAEVSER